MLNKMPLGVIDILRTTQFTNYVFVNVFREHTKCWDLSSFLIKPVQRVLKYPLLLNELFKVCIYVHLVLAQSNAALTKRKK